MRQDKRKVKYTMTIASQRYRGKPVLTWWRGRLSNVGVGNGWYVRDLGEVLFWRQPWSWSGTCCRTSPRKGPRTPSAHPLTDHGRVTWAG